MMKAFLVLFCGLAVAVVACDEQQDLSCKIESVESDESFLQISSDSSLVQERCTQGKSVVDCGVPVRKTKLNRNLNIIMKCLHMDLVMNGTIDDGGERVHYLHPMILIVLCIGLSAVHYFSIWIQFWIQKE